LNNICPSFAVYWITTTLTQFAAVDDAEKTFVCWAVRVCECPYIMHDTVCYGWYVALSVMTYEWRVFDCRHPSEGVIRDAEVPACQSVAAPWSPVTVVCSRRPRNNTSAAGSRHKTQNTPVFFTNCSHALRVGRYIQATTTLLHYRTS